MSRWKHILTNGLEKEKRVELLKLYLPPENCGNLKAPKLNLEIKAALSEINAKKDQFNQNKQEQLGSCLAALGKVLNILLSSEQYNPQDLIKPIGDAGRLLCDYHYKESQSRRYGIINTLNKEIRDTIKNSKIDEFLFGADLAEQLKSAKAITRSGSELKSRPPFVPPAVRQPTRGALNSRGARGAASTTRQPLRRPPPPASSRPAARDYDRQRHSQPSTSRPTSQRGRMKKY